MKNSLDRYFSELQACLTKIEAWDEEARSVAVEQAVSTVIGLILKTKRLGKKVIFIGNGGSAAIASHQAVDLWKNGGIRAIAFNDASLLTCVSNDLGYEYVFEKPIEMFADEDDLLIAISSSGRSPNILRAVERAKAKCCNVVTLSGFRPDNPLRSKGQFNFYVASDSYGFVEISHLALCHYLADRVMAEREILAKTAK